MSSLKVVFAGTPEFASEILSMIIQAKYEVVLVMTQPDRPGGRGLKLQQSPVKQAALYHQIPVLQPHSLKLDSKYSEEAYDAKQVLETSTFDVMVVAAYGLILPKWLLDLGARVSPLGCINVHASLLPRWRGAAPIQRAILAGDQQTGTCIMRMAEGLDTGPIILQEALTISAQDTAGVLHGKLALQGGKLLNEVLNGLSCGQVFKLQEQANEGVIYAQKILKEEAKIDWKKDAVEIDRLIRAFSPSPGAYTYLNQALLKIGLSENILRAVSSNDQGLAGQIIQIDEDGILVAGQRGVLRILEVQRPGAKKISAALFAKTYHLEVGQCFSSDP